MQELFNLSKWNVIAPEAGVMFTNDKARMVRLEVNAPQKTRLYVIDDDGTVNFLAVVEGRDTIKFGVDGKFTLTTEDDVSVYTPDGDDIHFVVIDAVSFTEIAERRPRNPEMEQLLYTMNQNIEARMQHQAEELERRYAERPVVGTPPEPSTIAPPVASPSGEEQPGQKPLGTPEAGSTADDDGTKPK